jgi:uncharacterized cupredoxin-like copper-binding protein
MKILILAALAIAAPAVAQKPNWTKGTAVSIVMTNRGFVPERIVMKRGATYILHFRNRSDRTHNFAAGTFFKYARVSPADQAWVTKNEVQLRPGEAATIHIIAPDTPSARYDYRSTRIEDAASNMKGAIYVR